MAHARSVLFTGYAPVHFLCFRPLFDRLSADPDFEVFVAGGLRTKGEDGESIYDAEGLYGRFGIASEQVLSMDEIAGRDFDVLFSSHTNLIPPRHHRASVQIFHGISFRNRGLRPANMGCDHYFVVGPYMERRLVSTGLMEADDPRIVRVGFMKTDPLVDGSLDREAILARQGMSGDRPVVLYAPTGAANNSLQSMGEEVIQRLSDSGRFDVLIKLHDHPKDDVDWHARLAPLEGPHVKVVSEDDVIPMLFAADLLISDASSVSNEFTMLDRPIVFLDVPEMLDKASRAKFQTLDLDTWGRRAGRVVARPEDAAASVAAELSDPEAHRSTRRAMREDLFYNPGRATDVALDWLRKLPLQEVA